MGRTFLLALLTCAVVNTESSAESTSSTVTYSPWTKICMKDGGGTTWCSVSSQARPACQSTVASVAFIEREGDATATLRVTLRAADRNHGVQILIDQDQPIGRAFDQCLSQTGFCAADHQVRAPDFVARLKSGRAIAVQGVDTSNQSMIVRFRLAGFADAYDGPGGKLALYESPRRRQCDAYGCYFDEPPSEVEKAQQALQDELQRCAEEARKKREAQQ
jgi:invasion protein IalB